MDSDTTATWRLYAPAGAWHLPSTDPKGIYAACLLQLLQPNQWELFECATEGPDELPALVRSDDRPSPSLAHPSPLAVVGSPDSKLSAGVRSSLLAYTVSAHERLRPLTDHTLYSLPANWALVTRPALVSAYGGSLSRLWGPERRRAEARERLESWKPEPGGPKLASKGEGLWGLAAGGLNERDDDDEVLRRKAEGPVAGKKAEEEQTKKSLKASFDVVRLQEVAEATLKPYDHLLASSSTPFFCSSPTPTSLDLALFSHLSLILVPDWKHPVLADFIRARFPRLVRQTNTIQTFLFPPPPSTAPRSSHGLTPRAWPAMHRPAPSISLLISSLVPSFSWPALPWTDPSKDASRPPDGQKEKEFKRGRWLYLAGVAVTAGIFGWSQGLLFAPRTSDNDEE